jgi:hypothetical protein
MSTGKTLRLLTIPIESTVRETDAAVGIAINAEMVWFPKSQIQDFEVHDGAAMFWCPDWLIEAKEVETFVDTSYEPSLF